MNNILKSMSTSPVVTCRKLYLILTILYQKLINKLTDEKEKGTQIKLLLLLADGTDVLVKPMK